MKTSILRIVCVAFAVLLLNSFVIKAEKPFYTTKWESGRMVSKTQYAMGYYGMYEPKFEAKYEFDEKGDFLKKEVLVWNPKYDWNDKVNRWEPDYSESNWIPQYCIRQEKNVISNFVTFEMFIWNKKKGIYGEPAERMFFQLDEYSDRFNYLAFQKGEKYEEWVNNINYDRALLAKFAENAVE